MSRARLLPSLLIALSACNPPDLDYLHGTSTGSTGESSGGGSSGASSDASTTSVMTTAGGSGSGAGTTTTTGPETTSAAATSLDTTTAGDPPLCGDGVIEGEEECDDGNDLDDDRCAQCTKNRWIFASAAYDHQGDLGGLDGADSLCRQYALQSGRADDTWMTFIAWLSDADHDVRDRLYPGRGRYVRTDGVVVVDSVDQLYSGVLSAPINLDEHGDPAPGGAVTGTNPDGTAAPGTHCQNWTSSSGLDFSAYRGGTVATDDNWTMYDNPEVNPTSCSLKSRLYCIEGA